MSLTGTEVIIYNQLNHLYLEDFMLIFIWTGSYSLLALSCSLVLFSTLFQSVLAYSSCKERLLLQ